LGLTHPDLAARTNANLGFSPQKDVPHRFISLRFNHPDLAARPNANLGFSPQVVFWRMIFPPKYHN